MTTPPVSNASKRRRRVTLPRVLAGVLVAFTAYTLLSQFLGAATDTPNRDTNRNPDSLSIDAAGTRAYAELLTSYGVEIRRYRNSLRGAQFSPDTTIVLLNPIEANYNDIEQLRRFAEAGGHLVVGSGTVDLSGLSPNPPAAQSGQHDRWTLSQEQSAQHNQAVTLNTASEASWERQGVGSIRIGASGDALLIRETVGQGRIDYLADTTLLSNELLPTGDNAAFSYALVDNGARSVTFLESAAVSNAGRGLEAIPDKWKLAAIVMFAAMALYAWQRGQRFGVPDQIERQLAPARSEYIAAMTVLLATADDHAGAQRVLASEAQRLLHSAELHETDVETLAAIHRCDPDDLRALFSMPPFEHDPVRAARAFAAIQSTTATLQVAGKDRS